MNYKECVNFTNKSYLLIQNIWKNHRWELFVIISILILIICYFFFYKEDESYEISKNYYIQKSHTPKRKPILKKNEKECKRILEKILNVEFKSVRPDFLKNPKTKKNLELDMYNEDLQLALEYQGVQHRKYSPYFHKKYTDFLLQLERDKFKKEICRQKNIKLICVPDNIKFNKLEYYIRGELKRLNVI